eukprot:GHVH01007995.1.p1 GENE.GHVH01007995.1~~GHVH01007995.1.p1  ORF type:complete len:778 (-),score=124.82 GHVH01007995.1:37-2370(-)
MKSRLKRSSTHHHRTGVQEDEEVVIASDDQSNDQSLVVPAISASDDVMNIRFSFNRTAKLYVAVSLNERFPIVSENDSSVMFKETGEIVSIYQAEDRNSRASIAYHYRVFEADVLQAWSDLEFTARGVSDPENFVLIFARPLEKEAADNIQCDGEEVIVSDTTNHSLFESCTESDSLDDDHNCLAGFNISSSEDGPGQMWKTAPSGGIGSFVEIRFTHPVRMSTLTIILTGSSSSWPKSLKVEFGILGIESSQGSRVLSISHSNAVFQSPLSLENTVARSLRISIDDVFDSTDSTALSMSFLIKGLVCHHVATTSRSGKESTVNISPSYIQLSDCREKLADYPAILNTFGSKSSSIHVGGYDSSVRPRMTCPSACLQETRAMYLSNDGSKDNPSDLPVWGGNWAEGGRYAGASELCASALHSGVCKGHSADCSFLIQLGPGSSELSAQLKNGLLSRSLDPSERTDYTFLVLPVPPEPMLEQTLQPSIRVSFIRSDLLPGGGHPDDSGALVHDRGLVFMKQQHGLEFGWATTEDYVVDVACPGDLVPVPGIVAFSRAPIREVITSDMSVNKHTETHDNRRIPRGDTSSLNSTERVIHEHIFGPPIDEDDEGIEVKAIQHHSVEHRAGDGRWSIKVMPGHYDLMVLFVHPCQKRGGNDPIGSSAERAGGGDEVEREEEEPSVRHIILVVNGEVRVAGTQVIHPGEVYYSSIPVTVGSDGLLSLSSPCPGRESATTGQCDFAPSVGDGEEGAAIDSLYISPSSRGIIEEKTDKQTDHEAA